MATGKYRDIIPTCKRLRSGPPTVYQLRPEKERTGALERNRLGEKNVNVIEKTVLVVGETGAGKSTLINALVNHAMGVAWEDGVWFQMVEDEKKEASASQTSQVKVYQVFGFEGVTLPYSLTIIDTPGYGDTRGLGHDGDIKEQLLDLFRSDDGVNEINVVALVLKASDNRLSERLWYVFDSVVSLFGKNIEKNIVALVTHSDGMKPQDALTALVNARIKCAQNEKKEPLHFLFNNRQSMERTEDGAFALKFAWDFTKDQMGKFTKFLGNSSPQKLNTTKDVLDERNRLNACVTNLQGRVETIELHQKQIQQERRILENCEDDMKKNENYIEEVEVVSKERRAIEGGRWGFLWTSYKGAMNCLVCEETCHHEGCIHATSPDDSRCVVMQRGRCTVCTKKCSTKVHVKDTWIFVTKTTVVEETRHDVKERYEKSKEESEKHLTTLQVMEKRMEEFQSDKNEWLDQSFQHVVKLDQIALNVDSLSTQVHLDFLITRMRERGDAEKLRKLEEMKSRMSEAARTAMKYMRH